MQKKPVDRGLLILTALLTLIGIIFVADVSAPQAKAFFSDSYFFVKQQLVWGILGIIALIIASKIHYSFWKKISYYLFFANIFLLILVLIPHFGNKLLGARRWISFGPITIQPSELVKLTLALYISNLADRKKDVLYYLIPVALVASLIMLEPDLGTTIIVVAIGLTQIFLAGIPLVYLASILGAGGVLGFILIVFSSYRKTRFMHFISGLKDPLDSSYHVKQILFALGSGGLFGVGIGQSKQKYLFLPEAATDSVFAIIAEEIGFIGSLAIIILLLLIVLRIFKIAKSAPDTFSNILVSGIGIWLGIQILVNLGSIVALIPLTGVPLPFFSYGGSSLTMLLLGIGIVLNISKYAKK